MPENHTAKTGSIIFGLDQQKRGTSVSEFYIIFMPCHANNIDI